VIVIKFEVDIPFGGATGGSFAVYNGQEKSLKHTTSPEVIP
jgi:hypothetical protein